MSFDNRSRQQNFLFYAILAIPACFAPLAIDLLVPSLPALADDLAASPGDTQLSIYTFLFAYGLAPFLWGSLSDRYGRKPLLVLGILMYAITSVACAFAHSIEVLIALRFLQGFAAAAGIVIARAMLRDMYGAKGTTRAISTLYMFLAVLPVLIPVFGGYLSVLLEWSEMFLVIAAIAVVSLLGVVVRISETVPSNGGEKSSAKRGMDSVSASRVLLNRHFLRNTMTNMFAMSATVLFVTNYSFLSTEVYSLSPQQNGYVLAGYNLSLAAGIYIVRLLVSIFGVNGSVRAGIVCLLAGWLGVAALGAGAAPPMLLLMSLLMLASFGHGVIMALSPGEALVPFSVGAGKASAIYSCIQSVGASLISYGVVLWAGKSLSEISLAIAVCAVCSALAYWLIKSPLEHASSPG